MDIQGHHKARRGGLKGGQQLVVGFSILFIIAVGLSCIPTPQPNDEGYTDAELSALLSLSPLPSPPDDTSNNVANNRDAALLGQYLFFDARLSSSSDVSCATCHSPDNGFSDTEQLSTGIEDTTRHAPTILNTVYNRWFFWDGRCDTHWCQALQPIEHPGEQDGNRVAIAHLVNEDEDLRGAYEDIFGSLPDGLGDPDRFPEDARPLPNNTEHPHHVAWEAISEVDQEAVTWFYVNIGKSIAAYERLLIQTDSPFDSYVDAYKSGSDTDGLLSSDAMVGFRLFVGKGNCILCHSGPTFTDLEFHNVGLSQRDWLDPNDVGRYYGVSALLDDPFNAAQSYSDDLESEAAFRVDHLATAGEQFGQFKTPSLRNVALSPPYMHGGHFDTLEQVVSHYSLLPEIPLYGHMEDFMLPIGLNDKEISELVAFLESLTGSPLSESLRSQPESPIP